MGDRPVSDLVLIVAPAAPVRLAELRSPQIGQVIAAGEPLCVLPVGATEQHGPHLPTGTDSLIATALCEAASARTGIPLLPTLWLSSSHAHTVAWPGTVSLSPRAVIALVHEVADWVASSGFTKLLLVNAHAGNGGVLQVAVEEIRHEGRVRPGLLHWYELDGVRDRVRADAGDWHANAAETALMLHLHPELVDRGSIRDDPDRTDGLLLSYTVHETSREGHTGSPSQATAAEGASLFATAVEELATAFDRARAEVAPTL
jgi:creatinine amidohydrolase